MQFPNCPLCDRMVTISKRSGDERDGYQDTLTVSCTSCGCNASVSGDTSKGGYADNSNLREKLYAKWSKRPTV